MDGGGWTGGYKELGEVVWRLEREGEKQWKAMRNKKNKKNKKKEGEGEGEKAWRDWKEMEQLSELVMISIMKRNREDEMEREEEEEEEEDEWEEEEPVFTLGEMLKDRIGTTPNVTLPPPTTSLDGIQVELSPNEGVKREGNTLVQVEDHNAFKNCFIGGVLKSVWYIHLILLLSIIIVIISLYISESISHVCIDCFFFSTLPLSTFNVCKAAHGFSFPYIYLPSHSPLHYLYCYI